MRNIKGVSLGFVLLGLCPALVLGENPSIQPASGAAEVATPVVAVPSAKASASGVFADIAPPPAGSESPLAPDAIITSASAVPGSTGASAAENSAAGSSPSGSEPVPHRVDRNDGTFRNRVAQRLFGPVSPKEISDAMIYLQEHSPKRAAAIQSLEGDRKQRVMEVAARNYVNWMRILRQDPELYKIVVQRVEVEDRIFDLVTKLRKAPADQQQLMQSKLHDQVVQLVDLGLQDRQIRLYRLQKTVKDLASKLDQDVSHRSDLVDQRLKTILSEEKGLLPTGGGAGGGGGGNSGLGGGPGGPGDSDSGGHGPHQGG